MVSHKGRVAVDGVTDEKCLTGGVKCFAGGRIRIRRSNIVGGHGSGIACIHSGKVEVLDTGIKGCNGWGLCVTHDTSCLVMSGGRIEGCKVGGLLCSICARAWVKNVEVVGCGGPGVEKTRHGMVLTLGVRVDGRELQVRLEFRHWRHGVRLH